MPAVVLPCQLESGPFRVLICYPGTFDVRTEVCCQREYSHEVFFFSLSF